MNSSTLNFNTIRKRFHGISVFIFLSVFLLVSCTDNSVKSPENEQGVIDNYTMGQFSAQNLLSGKILNISPGNSGLSPTTLSHMDDEGSFAIPLFGMTTAPNGEILVADFQAGVANRHGGTEISFFGVTDISPVGTRSLWVTATGRTGGDPTMDTGQSIYRLSQGRARLIANLFAFEEANDPDGHTESNPFDVQSLGGDAALVADAAGNDLLKVYNDGRVELLAVFPDQLVSTADLKNLIGCPIDSPLCGLPDEIPAQPVPTSIAVGPDGYYYIGELKGFPAPLGVSNIWRVSPDASGAVCGNSDDCVKVFDGGFTSIIDMAFDAEGYLHVAEIDELSWFAVELGLGIGGTINSCDIGTLTCSEVATGIPIITAITFGNDGSLWATKNALIPGLAEVIQIQ